MNEDQLRDELMNAHRQLNDSKLLAMRNEFMYRELKGFCQGYALAWNEELIPSFIQKLEVAYEYKAG